MNNNIEGKLLKKANTYISNMLTDTEKKEVDINLCFRDNHIIFNVINGDISFGYSIPCEIYSDIVYKVKYNDLKNAFKSIKIKDVISFILEDNLIKITNIDGEHISTLKANTVDSLDINNIELNEDSVVVVYANSFFEAIKINKTIAKKSDINFCDKICFKIDTVNMHISNMDNNTCIINKLNIFNKGNKNFNFAVYNDDISCLSKWNKSIQDNKVNDKIIKINVENGYLIMQSSFEFFRIKIFNDIIVDTLSKIMHEINSLKFDTLNQKKIMDISESIINETKSLSDDEENYKLNDNMFNEKIPIVVNKQSFINIIKNVNEMSDIGIATNSNYTPIIITYMGDYLRTKIIFNIIKEII